MPYTKSKLNGAFVSNEFFVCGIRETKDGFRASETPIRSRNCLSKSHGRLFVTIHEFIISTNSRHCKY